MWFDEQPVFGHGADNGNWSHPSSDCGRDRVPVPPMEARDAKWLSTVDSRSTSLAGGSEVTGSSIVSLRAGGQDTQQVTCSESNLSGARSWQSVPVLLGQRSDTPQKLHRSGDQYSWVERLDTFSRCSPGEGWCCHWLREVRKHHQAGEVICCAVSNIYDRDAWPATERKVASTERRDGPKHEWHVQPPKPYKP